MSAALVTGAARRVGRELALHLAANGYDIALHYHTSKKEARATAADIRALGRRCELFSADLADGRHWPGLIEKAHAAFAGLSVLVNSASVFDRGGLADGDAALFEKEFRINLTAPVFLTQAFARQVGRGVVVNMLDSRITQNKHPYGFYLLAKKALAEFTRMAAVELGPDIRVNGVCPGYVLPPEGWDDHYRASLEKRLPLGKTATVDDIAKAVWALIANESLTGQFLFVDGGESLI